MGTSHSGLLPLKWLISTVGFSLRDYSHWGGWFPPWSWSCDIAWHSILIFFFLFDNSVLSTYFHHFLYKTFLIIVIITLIGDYLFTLSKGKSTFFYYYYYHVCLPWFIQSNSTCHGHMNEVPSKRGIVYAQARPKWVAVWLVSTPLLRTLRPSTAGGSPAQHYKNAHHRPQKGGKWYLHPILWDIICVKFRICFFKKNKVDRDSI